MINYDLRKIKALAFDVDGVLSAETITLHPGGEPMRTVNIKEGLGIPDVHLGCAVKIKTYEAFLERYGLRDEEVLYMGDDIPDYEVMQRCGCPCAPADAAPEIKALAVYISHLKGGYGCGRDVIEQVLKAQGLWLKDEKAFGW